MYDHVGLKVKNVDASVRFYEAVLGPLGLVLGSRDETCAGLGPKGSPALWLYPSARSGTSAASGMHIGFTAPDRAAVDRFHAAGLASGGRDNGGPGVREDYGPGYYAAFLLDPDGNNIEAVCLR